MSGDGSIHTNSETLKHFFLCCDARYNRDIINLSRQIFFTLLRNTSHRIIQINMCQCYLYCLVFRMHISFFSSLIYTIACYVIYRKTFKLKKINPENLFLDMGGKFVDYLFLLTALLLH